MNFIQITDNVLTKLECETCILDFERSKENHKFGIISSETNDENVKKSTDLYLSFSEQNNINDIILPKLIDQLKKYRKSFNSFDYILDWTLCSSYNFQRYFPKEGYYSWHSELHYIGTPPNPLYSTRVLAWMFYLNDVDDGGTEFMNQKETIEAKCGRCVIWPAFWTHTHRGQISHTKTKYIVTGWCNHIIELY